MFPVLHRWGPVWGETAPELCSALSLRPSPSVHRPTDNDRRRTRNCHSLGYLVALDNFLKFDFF